MSPRDLPTRVLSPVPDDEPQDEARAKGEPAIRATPGWSRRTASGFEVELEVEQGEEALVLRSARGRLCARLLLRDEEVMVDLRSASLCLRSAARLRLESEHIELEAGESLRMRCGGLTQSYAFEHHIESSHGEVRIEANDDVALDGERIRLNSPKVAPVASTPSNSNAK